MEYEELKSLVTPEHYFIALKVLLYRNTNEVPIPKIEGSYFADVIWPQVVFENKDEIGEALIELLCTDKLLTLPNDDNKKDALVITAKGEKVIKYLFDAIEHACANGNVEQKKIDQIPRPYCYYVSDFFERSVNMQWASLVGEDRAKYIPSKEFCIGYYKVFTKDS